MPLGNYHFIYSIAFKLGDTLKGASVFAFTSSTVTPSATSIKVSPSVWSTSNTANSVIILETHFWPVKGNVHSVNGQPKVFIIKSDVGTVSLTGQDFWVSFLVDMILKLN